MKWRIFEWFLIMLSLAMVIYACVVIAQIQGDIEQLQGTWLGKRAVVSAESYLPENFNPDSEGYRAALERYEIEQGHVLPGSEHKKITPEAGTSEVTDTKRAS